MSLSSRSARSRYGIGVGWSLTSAFLWATTYVSGRYLMAAGSIDPVTLSMLRFLIGCALLMAAGALLFRKKLFAVSAADLARLSILGAFGVAGMSLFFFIGQKTVSAISSSLIMQTSPVMICFLSIFIGERLSMKGVTGTLISLIGCLFVIGVFNSGSEGIFGGLAVGCLCIFLSAFCWAVYSVAGKPLVQKLGGFPATAWAMVFGAAEISVFWLFGPFEQSWPKSPIAWSVVAYIAVFPTAVAFLAWYEAMEWMPLALLNVMQYLTPVFTVVLAWLILGERMSMQAVIGAVLILAGVAMTTEKVKSENI